MCRCTDGQAHGIDKPRCGECQQRAVAGPHYDPRRRTGRTTGAIKSAVMAAAFGKRVAYIACTTQQAIEHCRTAVEFITSAGVNANRFTYGPQQITFYYHNGDVAGIMRFLGMGSADNINRGLRDSLKYAIVNDHYTDELLVEKARKEARMADCATVVELLRKHGFTGVDLLATGGAHWTRSKE